MFWAIPKIWLHLVPLQKHLCQHKKQFYWMQIIFWSGAKCLWLSQYVNKFLVRHKIFGPVQNILEPVKGQGITYLLRVTQYKSVTMTPDLWEYVSLQSTQSAAAPKICTNFSHYSCLTQEQFIRMYLTPNRQKYKEREIFFARTCDIFFLASWPSPVQ